MLLSFTAGLASEGFGYAVERAVLVMQLGGHAEAWAYAMYGDKLAAKHDYKTALRCYDRSVQLKTGKKNVELYLVSRGYFLLSELRDAQAARDDFSRAIEANPNYACSFAGRGDARLELGERLGALHDFEQAVRLDPSFKIYVGKKLAKLKIATRTGRGK